MVEIEIPSVVAVVELNLALLIVFVTISTICCLRLLFNFIMRKKNILPPLILNYKNFKIIMLLILLVIIILSVILALSIYAPSFYKPILIVGIIWMLAYTLIPAIMENLSKRKIEKQNSK